MSRPPPQPQARVRDVDPPDAPLEAESGWWLYLLECGDGSWYAGISNDLQARLRAHAEGRGARYTRGRGPFTLLASSAYPDRASASRAEWRLKQLPRARKRAFFEQPVDASC